jgi:hypothetical protein
MVLNMKVNGKKTSNMAKERKHGLMEHAMKATMLKVKRMVLESLYGLMALLTQESSLTITFMEEECTCGQTIDAMKESG